MTAPWYTYFIALIVGIPVFALWAIGVYMLVKALISWVLMDPNGKAAPKPKTGS